MPPRNSSVILFLLVALLLGAGVMLLDRIDDLEDRQLRLEERLRASEAALDTLAPLQQLFAGKQLEPASKAALPYAAAQVTGEPDVEVDGADSARAWCPATENGGEEWLLLDYGAPVEAVALRLHANWNPGALVRVLAVDGPAEQREIWSGPAGIEAAAGIQERAFPEPQTLQRLKLIFDTAAVPGWNEIDAVGLLGADGALHWAESAEASSAWAAETTTAGDGAPQSRR